MKFNFANSKKSRKRLLLLQPLLSRSSIDDLFGVELSIDDACITRHLSELINGSPSDLDKAIDILFLKAKGGSLVLEQLPEDQISSLLLSTNANLPLLFERLVQQEEYMRLYTSWSRITSFKSNQQACDALARVKKDPIVASGPTSTPAPAPVPRLKPEPAPVSTLKPEPATAPTLKPAPAPVPTLKPEPATAPTPPAPTLKSAPEPASAPVRAPAPVAVLSSEIQAALTNAPDMVFTFFIPADNSFISFFKEFAQLLSQDAFSSLCCSPLDARSFSFTVSYASINERLHVFMNNADDYKKAIELLFVQTKSKQKIFAQLIPESITLVMSLMNTPDILRTLPDAEYGELFRAWVKILPSSRDSLLKVRAIHGALEAAPEARVLSQGEPASSCVASQTFFPPVTAQASNFLGKKMQESWTLEKSIDYLKAFIIGTYEIAKAQSAKQINIGAEAFIGYPPGSSHVTLTFKSAGREIRIICTEDAVVVSLGKSIQLSASDKKMSAFITLALAQIPDVKFFKFYIERQAQQIARRDLVRGKYTHFGHAENKRRFGVNKVAGLFCIDDNVIRLQFDSYGKVSVLLKQENYQEMCESHPNYCLILQGFSDDLDLFLTSAPVPSSLTHTMS